MTNNEAIKLIQGIEEDGRNVTSEHIEALDLAIKALEERPQGEWKETGRLNDPEFLEFLIKYKEGDKTDSGLLEGREDET